MPMIVKFIRRGPRNQLVCVRDDATTSVSDVGPNLPFHDIAHLIVERAFGLDDGFFGNIRSGHSAAQLSDKEVIRRLGTGPYRAEILTRALASLETGACAPEEFETLVNAELALLKLDPMHIPATIVEALSADYRALLATHRQLSDGESMELVFDP